MAPSEFFVLIPDLPNAPRARVRPLHMARVLPLIASGRVLRFGGATLAESILTDLPEGSNIGEALKFTGSAMLVVAESEEEVRESWRVDPYVTEGVWDWERARIWPMKVVVSQAVEGR